MSSTLDALTEFTIAFWFKLRGNATGSDYILSFPEDTTGANGVDFKYTSSGTITAEMFNHTGSPAVARSGHAQDAWHFAMINCKYTGTNSRGLFYTDGGYSSFNLATSGGIKHAAGTIELGRFGTFGAYADVELAEIAVWTGDVADDQATVTVQDYIYNNKLSPALHRPESLLLYMPVLEDSATAPAWVGALSSYTSSGGTHTEHPPGIKYHVGPIVVTSSVAVGGSTFNKTASESFSLGDAPAENADFIAALAEALSLLDTTTEAATFAAAVAESLVLADASTETISGVLVGFVDEVFSLSDTAARTAILNRAIADAIALSDTTTETAAFVRSVVETFTLADTAAGSSALLAAVAESLVLSDSSSESSAFASAVAEALGLADTSSEIGVLFRAVVESLSLLDSSTGEGGEQIPVEEARGGMSMSLRQMRRLEREQLLAMIREDDEVIASLVASLMRRGRRLN